LILTTEEVVIIDWLGTTASRWCRLQTSSTDAS